MNDYFEEMNIDYSKLNDYEDIETYYDKIKDYTNLVSELQSDRVESQKYIVRANKKIIKLQSNWNSLKEWLKTDEQKYFTFQPKQNGKTLQAGIKVGLDMVLDKMNELESSEN